MRYRPDPYLRNGCGLVAVAALVGGEPASYMEYVVNPIRGRWAGKFIGTTVHETAHALRAGGADPTSVPYARYLRYKLESTLPLVGRGVASVFCRNSFHALAYDGKMVYDCYTGGRWMWVYDHPWAKASVRNLLILKEKE